MKSVRNILIVIWYLETDIRNLNRKETETETGSKLNMNLLACRASLNKSKLFVIKKKNYRSSTHDQYFFVTQIHVRINSFSQINYFNRHEDKQFPRLIQLLYQMENNSQMQKYLTYLIQLFFQGQLANHAILPNMLHDQGHDTDQTPQT